METAGGLGAASVHVHRVQAGSAADTVTVVVFVGTTGLEPGTSTVSW